MKITILIPLFVIMICVLPGVVTAQLAESDHPYANNFNYTWPDITDPGASQMRLHFVLINLSIGDKIKILDKDGNLLVSYQFIFNQTPVRILKEDFWTEWFPVDTVKVRLETNKKDTAYGFLLDRKETRVGTSVPTPSIDIPTPSIDIPTPSIDIPTPSIVTQTSTKVTPVMTKNIPKTSVEIYGEKTDVNIREDILLKVSAINLITKPKMFVQVILVVPSGFSVTGMGYVKSSSNQYTSNYEIQPGDQINIDVSVKPNQEGDFNVKGKIIYYFENDKENEGYEERDLPIKVRGVEQTYQPVSQPTMSPPTVPGFTAGMVAFLILIMTLFTRKL